MRSGGRVCVGQCLKENDALEHAKLTCVPRCQLEPRIAADYSDFADFFWVFASGSGRNKPGFSDSSSLL